MNALLRLYDGFVGGRPGVGLLIFRVVTGLALMIHGWPKIQNPMSWMPPEAGVAPAMQLMAAICEFGGGLLLLLGLLTPIACIMVAAVMIGALVLVHIPAGQSWIGGRGGSMELPISYLVSSIVLFLTGPGKYSLDAKLFGNRTLVHQDVERKEHVTIR